MKSIAAILLISAAVALAAGKKLQLKDLPAGVQKTVTATAQGASITNIGKETEHGVQQYEIETMLNGKHRDFEVDTKGNLLVLEEESNIDAVPPSARAAILRRVGAGKLRTVETYTKTGQPTMYEAAYTTTSGKKLEVLVKADGSLTKE